MFHVWLPSAPLFIQRAKTSSVGCVYSCAGAREDTSDASATLAESDAMPRGVATRVPASADQKAAQIITAARFWTSRKGCPSHALQHLQPSAQGAPPEVGALVEPPNNTGCHHDGLPRAARGARGGAVAGGTRLRAKQHELAVRHVQHLLEF